MCCNGYTHMLQASVPNVSAISDVCCTCFIWVLHMFHTYVASVSSECCICFTHMLQVFHLYATYVLQWLHTCFPRVLGIYFKCFNYFECMLQMFPLDVAKVDLALHMLQWDLSAAVACCSDGPACMRVGVEGCKRQVRETVRSRIKTEWSRDTVCNILGVIVAK
jgi:hypothetical protein